MDHKSSKYHTGNQMMNPLVAIYQHTVNYCRKARFPVPNAVKYNNGQAEFNDENLLSTKQKFPQPAQIIVENIDSFDMARKMADGNSPVLVLNLASNTTGGGGVKNGARAQEEDLFRKSNYHEVTDQRLYRLKDDEVIYSPLVHIIKDSSYKLLEQPVPVACLAVAALRNPKLIVTDGRNSYARQVDIDIMQHKIDMIFKVAIKHGHQDLVLGALGCGVFNNPPEQVAIMFQNAISKYDLYFRRIGFAVLSKPGDINFTVFSNIFNNHVVV